MVHKKRKIRDNKNIKDAILKAALDIAKKDGWQGVSIRKIAVKVEYTTSIVYNHFENKEDLYRELCNIGFTQIYQALIKYDFQGMSAEEKLLQISLINWDFAAQNRELYFLMFSFERPSSENANKGMEIIRDIFAEITKKKENEDTILYWLCLRQGAIYQMIGHDENEAGVKSKDLYIDFIRRFIRSINI